MSRAARDDAVGPEIGHQMNRATAELAASDPLTSMPAVGDRAPLFELPNQNGDIVRLQQRLATGPAVLVCYRGGWCPYCNTNLRAYQQR